MRHRVYVMFELLDQMGAQPDSYALPNFVSRINQGLSSGYGLQEFRGRIVSAQSVEETTTTAEAMPKF